MQHSFTSYIKFLYKSTNQHGIHSPFVYDFTIKCLYKENNINEQFTKTINEYRKSLISNKNTINVTDFGAGSRVFNSNKRLVSAIAKNAGISKKRSKLLFNIVQYFKPQQILEIGTSLGVATTSLSLGNTNARIVTLEGCPETAKIAKNQFKKFKFNNIKIQIGEFKDTLPHALKVNRFDLIYFDGNHQKEATINYFKQCLPTANKETVFIFDDIHWNKNMEQAWEYIKNHEKVTVSVDTFQWGIIFFKKDQPKEHFIIRV